MTRNMLRGAAWIAAALIAMAPGLSARQDGQDPTRPVVEVQDLVKQIRERGALLVERLKEKSPQIAERLQKALLKINEETIREKLDEILAELRKKNPDNAAELASQVAASLEKILEILEDRVSKDQRDKEKAALEALKKELDKIIEDQKK